MSVLEHVVGVDESPNLDALRRMSVAAAIAWNAAVLEDTGEAKDELERTIAGSGSPEEAREWLGKLVDAKRLLFPNDFRLILDVEVFYRGGEPQLRAVAQAIQRKAPLPGLPRPEVLRHLGDF